MMFRRRSARDLSELRPGDEHYMAYVGPPQLYDVKGASQFRLLAALGLRASHKVLDVGCGSLRAGRLLIPYLDAGNYFGLDPNRWLVEEGIKHHFGPSIKKVKRPVFDFNDRFDLGVFGTSFDFVLAQSVLSHTGPALVETVLSEISSTLTPSGVGVVTFMRVPPDRPEFLGTTSWVYPECTQYHSDTIEGFFRGAGLFVREIPWVHHSQAWYIAATSESSLPSEEFTRSLRYVRHGADDAE